MNKFQSANQNISINSNLSPQEVLCLFLIAQGHSTNEISILIAVKPSTVVTYRKGILTKLACKNMPEAVFKGFCRDIIKDVR